ncbi:MAG: iron-containing alcohol dehydrogenase [Oceanospirillaceae bacterium]|nr:iron-containing alcohol dehydrogenase [Oceanospirillaceae bacterium]
MSILDTGIKNCKNVARYSFGGGNVLTLNEALQKRMQNKDDVGICFIDHYFKDKDLLERISFSLDVRIIYIDSSDEPTTDIVDKYTAKIKGDLDNRKPAVIVGIGGGCTMDVAKAVSNLLTNGGNAADYQGWDLVKVPGVYKIAVPTISGTGCEATRTCVMTNKNTGLKLGMNSDFTVFDEIIFDPDLIKTVPKNQYFYTGMDAYIHCVESLNGSYRNAVGDAFSEQTMMLCRDIFLSDNMKSDDNLGKLMVASYLGGCAIASSYVGVIHPFSAGLSVVLGVHHCIGNCIVMLAMEEFYPEAYTEFMEMVKKQKIDIPRGVAANLTDEQYDALYEATIIHERPLVNALGENYKEVLTKSKVKEIFKAM